MPEQTQLEATERPSREIIEARLRVLAQWYQPPPADGRPYIVYVPPGTRDAAQKILDTYLHEQGEKQCD